MLLLGIDLETTSLDVSKCHIIEIGLVLWSSEYGQPVHQYGGLVKLPGNERLPLGIESITGIAEVMLKDHGDPWNYWSDVFNDLAKLADAYVAHNIEFEQNILRRYDLNIDDKLWIDTMTDVPYSNKIKTRKLEYLCYEHQFFNPFPHRALTDVLSMLKILQVYDIDRVIEIASSPTVWLRANVSFDDKQLAKDLNYRWDNVNRLWVKRSKGLFVQFEQEQASFPVQVLQDYSYKEAQKS